jgi:hypothetical protein
VHHEHEAVELRLGQGIGALLLDRVLRREHEERSGSGGACRRRHLALDHRLEQRGLRLGRRAVDLVGEDRRWRTRPGREAERALVRRRVDLQELGAGDVAGIRSGVNWMRLNDRSSVFARLEISSVFASPARRPAGSARASGSRAGARR